MSSINIDEKLVKKVGDKNDIPMTQEESDEWDRCAEDKYYFFENYVYVQAAKGKMLFKPRDYQRRIIDACTHNRSVVAIAGRQAGKCIRFDTKIACVVEIDGVEYALSASIGDLHALAKCASSEEALTFIRMLEKRHDQHNQTQAQESRTDHQP